MEAITPSSEAQIDTAEAIAPELPIETSDAATPIALIEALDTHGRVHAQYRLVGAGSLCKIGRSLACELPIDDAYAAGEHTLLTLQDDGRIQVKDLGSRNGTRINTLRASDRLDAEATTTVDDGVLIIGKTRVRVRTQRAALAPERMFKRDVLQRHKTLFAILGVIAIWLLTYGNEWLHAPEQLAPKVMTSMLAVTLAIALWIGLWALVTRVGHGVWNLRLHVAIVCNALVLSALATWGFDIAAFALQWNWLSLFGVILAVLLILSALYLHLRVATHLTVRLAASIAIILPLTLGSAALWVNNQSDAHDVDTVNLGGELFPPTFKFATPATTDSYFDSATRLKVSSQHLREQSLAETPLSDPGD